MNHDWPRRIDDDAAQMLGRLSLGWLPGPLRITDAVSLQIGTLSRHLTVGNDEVRILHDFAEVDVETDQEGIVENRKPNWICIRLRGPRSERFTEDEITSRDNALVRTTPSSARPYTHRYELRDWWLHRRLRQERARNPGRFWVARLKVQGGSLPPGNVNLTWGTDRGFTTQIIRLQGTHTVYLVPSTEKRVCMLIDTEGQPFSRDEFAYDFVAMQFVLGGIVSLGYLMGLDQDDEIVQACAPPLSPFRGAPLRPPISLSVGQCLARQFRHLRSAINSTTQLTLAAIYYWHASQLQQPTQIGWSNLGHALSLCGMISPHAGIDAQPVVTNGEPTEYARELFTIASDASSGKLVDKPQDRLLDAQWAVAAAILWQAGHHQPLDMDNRDKYFMASEDYPHDETDYWLADATGVEVRRFSWARYSWRGGKVAGLLGQFEEYTRDFGRKNGPTLYATLSPRLLADGSDRIERYQFRLHARISPQVSVSLFSVHPSEGYVTVTGWHDEPLKIQTHEQLIVFLEDLSRSSEFHAQVMNLLILAEEQNQ